MVLTWEAKVVAAADADAAETNWKHKVTPDRGDLMTSPQASTSIMLTPYMVLPLFATRFTAYAGGIRVSFIQPRLF